MSDKIRCKHCPRSTYSSLDVARMEGWRLFNGVSQTGKHLDDVVCPVCAGTNEPPEPRPEGWVVACRTCEWQSNEDPDDPDLFAELTAKDAKWLAREHRCEKWMEIRPPGNTTWYPPDSINDDGSLVADPRLAEFAKAISR